MDKCKFGTMEGIRRVLWRKMWWDGVRKNWYQYVIFFLACICFVLFCLFLLILILLTWIPQNWNDTVAWLLHKDNTHKSRSEIKSCETHGCACELFLLWGLVLLAFVFWFGFCFGVFFLLLFWVPFLGFCLASAFLLLFTLRALCPPAEYGHLCSETNFWLKKYFIYFCLFDRLFTCLAIYLFVCVLCMLACLLLFCRFSRSHRPVEYGLRSCDTSVLGKKHMFLCMLRWCHTTTRCNWFSSVPPFFGILTFNGFLGMQQFQTELWQSFGYLKLISKQKRKSNPCGYKWILDLNFEHRNMWPFKFGIILIQPSVCWETCLSVCDVIDFERHCGTNASQTEIDKYFTMHRQIKNTLLPKTCFKNMF